MYGFHSQAHETLDGSTCSDLCSLPGGTAPASAVSRHMEKLLKARDFLSRKSVSRNGETSLRGTGTSENGGEGDEARRRPCEEVLEAHEREGEDENGGSHSQMGSSFFEALGFEYLGPVDGHDVESLVAVLSDLKVWCLLQPSRGRAQSAAKHRSVSRGGRGAAG